MRDFEAGKITTEQFAEGVVREFQLPVTAQVFLKNFKNLPKGLFDGTEDLLVELSAEYRLACFSNTNQLHWPMLRDRFKIGELMDECFISCQTGLLKPDVEAFEFVLNTLDCPPEQIMFFDDNPVNTSAAMQLGFNAFQVNGIVEVEKIVIEEGLL